MSLSLKDLAACMASCSGCGQCLPACPVYKQSGVASDSPVGKLAISHALSQGSLRPEDALAAIARCTLCGRCARACPQGLPLQLIFMAARRFLEPYLPARRKALVWALTKAPKVWDFCQPPLHVAQKLLPGKLPQVAFSPYLSQDRDKGAVLLFGGCLSRRLFPDLIAASIRALERHGHTVIWEAGLVCCGRPQALQGADIRPAVRRNLQAIAKYQFEWLTSPCPGCLAAITGLWPALSGLTPAESELCQALAAKSIDISLLLAQAGANGKAGNVFWHSPCLLSAEANHAASQLAGADSASSRELACCGLPLSLLKMNIQDSVSRLNALLRPARLPLQEKLQRAILNQAAGAACIATACPGCMLGLAGKLPVRHAVQIYNQQID